MNSTCCETLPDVKEKNLTMSMLESGSKGIIKSIKMNCDDSESCRFVRRLKEMGLHIGAHFEVMKNSGSGEVSVYCEGTTLALGQGMADKINVELSNGAVMEGTMFGRICRKIGIKCRP